MRFRCVGLGEVLWDRLPDGPRLGGAPANFAYHAAALGHHASVVSRVGADADGARLLAQLRSLSIDTSAIATDPVAPTGSVTVRVDARGQPDYTIHEGVAWDFLAADPAARAAVAAADAVCFGTLAQRHAVARQAIHDLLRLARPPALRVFDVNFRQHYHSAGLVAESLALANVLKVNETELPDLLRMFALPGDARVGLGELARRHRLRALVYTRGAQGCLCLVDGTWVEEPGTPVTVVDTIGAGDSFTAAFTLGLLASWPPELVLRRASAVAAYVCTQAGATPALPAALSAPFRETAPR